MEKYMNLTRLNLWRKIILASFIITVILMFAVDWGYHFHIGHVVRLAVGAFVFWLVVDRL